MQLFVFNNLDGMLYDSDTNESANITNTTKALEKAIEPFESILPFMIIIMMIAVPLYFLLTFGISRYDDCSNSDYTEPKQFEYKETVRKPTPKKSARKSKQLPKHHPAKETDITLQSTLDKVKQIEKNKQTRDTDEIT